jgi:hypothetical protein
MAPAVGECATAQRDDAGRDQSGQRTAIFAGADPLQQPAQSGHAPLPVPRMLTALERSTWPSSAGR